MATTLFLRNQTTNVFGPGTQYYFLRTTRGAGVTAAVIGSANSANLSIWTTANGGPQIVWVSEPMDKTQNVTAATISYNLWGDENNNGINASLACNVYRWSVNTGSKTQIVGPMANTVEFTGTVRTGSATPAGNTLFLKGDRILVEVLLNFTGTPGLTGTRFCQLAYAGTTAGANGDSYITITDNLTFERRIFPST